MIKRHGMMNDRSTVNDRDRWTVYDHTFNRRTASIITIIFVPAAHHIYIGPIKIMWEWLQDSWIKRLNSILWSSGIPWITESCWNVICRLNSFASPSDFYMIMFFLKNNFQKCPIWISLATYTGRGKCIIFLMGSDLFAAHSVGVLFSINLTMSFICDSYTRKIALNTLYFFVILNN